MEQDAAYVLLVFMMAGSLSLWSYVSFWRGADNAFQRRVASFAIRSGMRHLPVMQALGAAFWYSIALAALTIYLPESPLSTVAMAAGLLLVLITVVLFVVWAYRPPRRLLPQWYQAELDQAPRPRKTKPSRVFNIATLWLSAIFLASAYAAFRLEAPWFLWIAGVAVGATFLVAYVMHE
jgi:hypothetical protein